MAISNLPDQKTPARPVELTFAPQTTPPNANQNVVVLGHVAATGFAASGLYVGNQFVNSGDTTIGLVNATAECVAKFGNSTCELAQMLLAAVAANQQTGQFPQLAWIALASTDVDFGAGTNKGLTALNKLEAEFIVSPYDGANGSAQSTLGAALAAAASVISGPNNPANSQFGSVGVQFNRSVVDPSTLPKYDTQFLMNVYLYDSATLGASAYSVPQMAAAAAALAAGNPVPFNPLDDVVLNGVPAPKYQPDWPTVGFGMQSEAALNQGWTPLRVLPNGSVAFVRTVTARLTQAGTPLTAYYDLQDFQVLYYWRKTWYTRMSQPDMKQRKASAQAASLILSEMVRLATLFQTQQMFQAVDLLAPQFVVQRDTVDRSRFNCFTPVNVIPGLHVIDTNVQATTQFDQISV